MRTLIIIPALDESETIGTVIHKIKSKGWHDILVVDDGSVDDTGLIAQRSGAQVITLPINIGAWGAIQTGMIYAIKKGYPRVVTIDADDQHEPDYIDDLVKNIQGSSLAPNGFDVVIGSCLSRGSFFKQIAWNVLKKLSGLKVQDLTSGFRAYNSTAIQTLLNKESLMLDYQDIGVLLLCKKKQLKIGEITVKMNQRANGHSRVYRNAMVIGKYLLSTLFLIGTKRW